MLAPEPSQHQSVALDYPTHTVRGVSWRLLTGPVLTAVAYYIAAEVGAALAFPAAPVSAFWAPNALVLAALLLAPVRRWWMYFAAILPLHFLAQATTTSLDQIVIQYVVNSAEALIGAAALVHYERTPVRLDSLRAMTNLIVIGGIVAPLVTSLIMGGAFVARGLTNDIWLTVIARTITNTFATITLVPLVLHGAALLSEDTRHRSARDLIEATIVGAALVVVCLYVFASPSAHIASGSALLYAPLPLLILATVRFGLVGVCGSVLLLGTLATWGVLHDIGPFVTHSPVQNALATVLFLNVTCVPLLLLASVLAERKGSAIALERSQALHDSVMASLRDEIAVLDSRGIVLDANASWLAAADNNGYGTARVGEDYLAAVTQAAHREPGAAALSEALDTVLCGRATRRELELAVSASDTVRWYEHSIESLQRPSRGAVITRSDITARKRAEIEVHEQQQHLAHLARAAILGEFSGAIAHEIRQPLTAMLANAEAAASLLSTDPLDREAVHDTIADIIADNLRAAQVIQRVQSMLRKAEQPRTRLHLNELVKDSLALARGDLARHRISLRATLDETLPPVFGDRVQVQQVILNLVANACDSMAFVPEGERTLTIVTHVHSPEYIELAVSDTGTGIPDDQLPHIFEPFVTSKSRGLGLGLSICRSIIASHHGKFWAENLPRGAMFHVTLPLAAEHRPATA